MKSNTKPKIKLKDKVASTLFHQILETLLDRYDKSEEKKTMSFKAYCIGLVNLSYKQVGSESFIETSEDDEYIQKILEEGEMNNECST